MKTNRTDILIGIAIAGLFSPSFASAAGNSDLSNFRGNYKGTAVQSGSGTPGSGPALVKFKVPQAGSSAVIDYTATVSDGMITTFLPTSLTLMANKSVSVTDLLIGIAGTNNAKPGTGTWSQRRQKLTITSSNGQGTSLNVSAAVKDLRKKRTLTLILTTSDGVDTTTFTTNLKARLPRR